jgi:hypothetical protein
MMVRTQNEQEVLDLARQTAERLEALTSRLEAYIDNNYENRPDTGKRRRSDDGKQP